MKQNQKNNDNELNKIQKNSEFFLARIFLNELMLKEETLKSLNKEQNDEFNTFYEEIEICCTENLTSLLNYLIDSFVFWLFQSINNTNTLNVCSIFSNIGPSCKC